MLNYDSITLLSLLRSSDQQIGRWLTNLLPLINNGKIKNITVTCGLRSQYLDALKKICNLNIIDVPFNNNNGEDPLLKHKIYRDCWNLGLSKIESEYVFVVDDDIIFDEYVVDNFIKEAKDELSLYYGLINYRNASNLMVSFLSKPMEIYSDRFTGIPQSVYYAAPAMMFSKTDTLKLVASNLKGLEENPYYCTGFEIAKNAINNKIRQIVIPTIVGKHG